TFHARNVSDAAWQVPLGVKCHGRTGARERVHLPGVGELLFDRHRGRRLAKHAEAGTRVGKAPRGQLDPEAIESLEHVVAHRRNASLSPPSTGTTCPVVRALSSPASQQMALAQSAGMIGCCVIVRWA